MAMIAEKIKGKVTELRQHPENVILYSGIIATVVLMFWGYMLPSLKIARTAMSIFMIVIALPVLIYVMKKERVFNFKSFFQDVRQNGLICSVKDVYNRADESGIVKYIKAVFVFSGIIALLTFTMNIIFSNRILTIMFGVAATIYWCSKVIRKTLRFLSKSIANIKMKSIVNANILEHQGGENFFNAMDEMIRNDNVLLSMMISSVLSNEKFDFIIVSGNFGRFFKKYCLLHMRSLYNRVIVVNGGQRKGNGVTTDYSNYNVCGKRIIFIDDSFYSGKTRNVIKASLESNGATLVKTYVFYDGSKDKDKDVYSFYRYY